MNVASLHVTQHSERARCQGLRHLSVDLGLHVDVAQTPVVDGAVPLLPELRQRRGVPPVFVEQTVGEHGDFGEDVQQAVEDTEEQEKPDDKSRQGAAENAVDDVRRRVRQNGVHELHHDDVHQQEGDAHVRTRAEDVGKTDRLRAWIVQLVQQRGAHPIREDGRALLQEVAVMAKAVRNRLRGLLLHAIVGEDEGVALECHDYHQHHRKNGGQRTTGDSQRPRSRNDGPPDDDGVHDHEHHLHDAVNHEGHRVGEVQLEVRHPQSVVLQGVDQDPRAQEQRDEHALPAASARHHVEGDEPAALREVVDLAVRRTRSPHDQHDDRSDHVNHGEVVEALERILLDLVHQVALHEVVDIILRRTLLEGVRVERRLRALHQLLLARALHRGARH